jgi:hypothetical protein
MQLQPTKTDKNNPFRGGDIMSPTASPDAENAAKALEQVIIKGDLSSLAPLEKVKYYNAVCKSIGLNPLTKPFEYIKLNGREVLYALKGAADQLCAVHSIDIEITETKVMNEVYLVIAKAKMPSGRGTSSTGAVSIKGLQGDALANAFMKAETKAKRRAILSLCGLGMLDETEVADIPTAKPVAAPSLKEIASPDTPELIQLKKLIIAQKVPEKRIHGWLNKKGVASLEELDDKVVDYLVDILEKEGAVQNA